ncbi:MULTISPECIES: hypothetical protein [Paraburkholderia]|jgi:hypothetical protein|uniref:Uncharacterized protein n=1 Tax=Paraburkholderia steynii TaxID=1245441 RepID=A0A7Z7B473_9BURK|nr:MULTISPECIES: hypothetical protein [Paraburkholderia]EUC18128.1 hypothetical protein PMI06_003760 [Burkholderia sp. BT03]SKC74751.1 hypothetical protein SAMN05445504_1790 [Burkholderia sp. CF099]SOE48401.1 hypothetical protein SAMN05446935_0220 [Burkholderia sp. YR290]MDW3657572.1 hypothetical protein [Paraburkholderia terrae]SDG90449.1 hypothetical protein SAMN04487926_101127 [Paraburkholderia steynii]
MFVYFLLSQFSQWLRFVDKPRCGAFLAASVDIEELGKNAQRYDR